MTWLFDVRSTLVLIYDAVFCFNVDGAILSRVNPFDSTSDGDGSWQTTWRR